MSPTEFKLHPNLASKIFILDLPLCRVLLENHQIFPWLFLVPRRVGASRIIDLSLDDQRLLLEEMNFTQRLIWNEFSPTQLNVAAIGNKTPQLHIHVIARYETDFAWPHTVWDHPCCQINDENEINSRVQKLQSLFS